MHETCLSWLKCIYAVSGSNQPSNRHSNFAELALGLALSMCAVTLSILIGGQQDPLTAHTPSSAGFDEIMLNKPKQQHVMSQVCPQALFQQCAHSRLPVETCISSLSLKLQKGERLTLTHSRLMPSTSCQDRLPLCPPTISPGLEVVNCSAHPLENIIGMMMTHSVE